MVTMTGGGKLKAKLDELAKKLTKASTLRVGFIDGSTYPDGTPVAMVAAINNFGGGNSPPRPFFSNVVAAGEGAWGEKLASLMEKNDNDAEKSLRVMGMVIEGELRESIIGMQSPPNSPITNLLKQRFPMGKADGMTFDDVLQARADVAAGVGAPAGKPLIWSGTMLDRITSEVE